MLVLNNAKYVIFKRLFACVVDFFFHENI